MAIDRNRIDFYCAPTLLVNSLSVDCLFFELKKHHANYPLCLVSNNTTQYNSTVRLLRAIAPYPLEIVVEPKVKDEQSLRDIAILCMEKGCDSILACGPSGVQSTAKAIAAMIACGVHVDWAELLDSGILTGKSLVSEIFPLATIPFGDSDGNECQGVAFIEGHRIVNPQLVPCCVAVDPRFTAISTRDEIAANACTTLLHAVTSFQNSNLLMDIWLSLCGEYLGDALEPCQTGAMSEKLWMEVSSSAVLAQCLAGICAHNRGGSALVDLVEAIAVEGLANRHQVAAAFLPYQMATLREKHPEQYAVLQGMLKHNDPMGFMRSWITLSKTQGRDAVVEKVCGNCFRLLENNKTLKELKPLLGDLSGSDKIGVFTFVPENKRISPETQPSVENDVPQKKLKQADHRTSGAVHDKQ